MRVMLTRPRAESEALAEKLRAAGDEILIEPMLDIVAHSEPLSLDGIQAVLVTSANGVRCLAPATDRRDVPLFAVGDATARTATNAGFLHIESARGDSDALAALIGSRLNARDGALLHVRGRDTAGDLAGHLQARGFTVKAAILYRAEPAKRLSDLARARLEAEKCDSILFFSPRTARTFVSLIQQAGLRDRCAGIIAICLSQAVADEAGTLPWGGVRIAETPDQAAVIQAYDLLKLTKDTKQS